MPLPSLVSVPEPVVMVPATMPLPVPPKVRFVLVPVMLLAAVLKVRLSASELISTPLEPNVTVPCQTLLPLMLRSAPSAEIPVPLSVSDSAPTVMLFWICKAAPEVTEVPAAVVPRAVAFRMLSTPAFTAVVPV